MPNELWAAEWKTEIAEHDLTYPAYIEAGCDDLATWQLWKKPVATARKDLLVFPLDNSQADVGKEIKVRYNRNKNGVLIGHKWHLGEIV
jgi:hypothetical protein